MIQKGLLALVLLAAVAFLPCLIARLHRRGTGGAATPDAKPGDEKKL